MAKLTLTTTSAGYALATTLNANNTLIETALENTLSRDGTSPNTMSAALDMNSQQITNLPVPTNAAHAASKSYVDGIVTGFTSSATFSAALPYTITGSWDFETLTDFEAGFRVWETVGGTGDSLTVTLDGTDANHTYSPAVTAINFTGATYLDLKGGMNLRTWDNGDTDYVRIRHDGTDGLLNIFPNGGYFNISTTVGVKLQTAGSLYLNEQAAGLADIAAYGQLWVKSDAPNTFWFTDDTGVDQQLSRTFGSFTGTLTGYAAGPTGTFYWSKEPLDGTHWRVTLWHDPAGGLISGTSNANTLTMTGLPAAITPTTNSSGEVVCLLVDNGTPTHGSMSISTSNLISFSMDGGGDSTQASNQFTTSGTKGIPSGWSTMYVID